MLSGKKLPKLKVDYMKQLFLCIAMVVLCLSGCTSNSLESVSFTATPLIINPDQTSFEVTVEGNPRTGALYVPSYYKENKKYSLVIGLHGSGGTGEGFRSNGFDVLAERYGFIMVYPDAIRGDWEIRSPENSIKKDREFFIHLVREFQKEFSIDDDRVYITGHSNGGFMTYHLALELSGMFSAAAPAAGLAFFRNDVKLSKNVSLLHIHAMDDAVIPYYGYTTVDILSAAGSIEQWMKYNGFNGIPVRKEISGEVFSHTFYDKKTDTSISLCTYERGGHGLLPGSTELISEFFYNHPSRGNRISFENSNLESILYTDSAFSVQAVVGKPEEIKKIGLYSSGELVGELTEGPYIFEFKPEKYISYDLFFRAELNNGENLVSSDSKRFIVVDENLALNAIGKATSNETDYLIPGNVTDGDFMTRWASEYNNAESISLDLGQIRNVSGVSLFWEAAFGRQYKIEVSEDGFSWNSVFEQNKGTGGLDIIRFTPVNARFIRMRGEKRGTLWGYSLWEFMVH